VYLVQCDCWLVKGELLLLLGDIRDVFPEFAMNTLGNRQFNCAHSDIPDESNLISHRRV
jgi:hypothetical protein